MSLTHLSSSWLACQECSFKFWQVSPVGIVQLQSLQEILGEQEQQEEKPNNVKLGEY